MNGSELMAQYRAERSEAAFAQLVRGFGSLVYSVARRQLREAHLAEEVAQEVFTRLARSAPSFATNGELVAWLHRTSVHVAIDVWRAESRRQVREQKASMERVEEDDRGRWEEIGPHLDDAINQLSDLDRQAVLVRFFERKSMREVGAVLGVSEDAAKMRVSRALERLRSHFAAKGVAFGLTAGSELLLLHSVEAAPPPVLMRLEGLGGLASVQAGAGGMAGAILPLIIMTKAKLIGLILLVAAAGLSVVVLRREPDNATPQAAVADRVVAARLAPMDLVPTRGPPGEASLTPPPAQPNSTG